MTTGTVPVTTPGPSKPCIRRGRQWLSAEELQAHLASLLRLENVAVLLGSGASAGAVGGMTMAQLWEDFKTQSPTSHAWLVRERFIDAAAAPNLESLADTLEIALKEWKRTSHPQLDELTDAKGQLQRAVIRAALLNEEWWEQPGMLSTDLAPLDSHRELLQKITAARQPGQPAPWVFTTNYDLAVEWTAETIGLKTINGFDGLHMRLFAPHNFDLGWRNVQARGEARFGTYHVYLAKLHGSLTWLTDPSGSVLEHSTTGAWDELKDFLAKSDGELSRLMVLPSATKYDRTVGFVLGEMFRRLAEFLAQPQSVLIVCGYSFSDEHLNRLLVTALQNPTLQLVICSPEAFRDANDELDTSGTTHWLKTVLAYLTPQVTLLGGGSDAHLAALVRQMPDPAVYDEQASRIRGLLKELRGSTPDGSS